jgi:hypothetical protein
MLLRGLCRFLKIDVTDKGWLKCAATDREKVGHFQGPRT